MSNLDDQLALAGLVQVGALTVRDAATAASYVHAGWTLQEAVRFLRRPRRPKRRMLRAVVIAGTGRAVHR